MSAYGYEIVQTLIVDIEPDEHVKRAMNEINAGKLLTTNICLIIYISLISFCLEGVDCSLYLKTGTSNCIFHFFFCVRMVILTHLYRNGSSLVVFCC